MEVVILWAGPMRKTQRTGNQVLVFFRKITNYRKLSAAQWLSIGRLYSFIYTKWLFERIPSLVVQKTELDVPAIFVTGLTWAA